VTLRPSADGRPRVSADSVEVDWGARGGDDPRAHLRGIAVQGLRVVHGRVAMEWPVASFDVLAWTRTGGEERVRLRQRGGAGELEARWSGAAPAGAAALAFRGLDLAGARIAWDGEPVLDPGRWTGRAALSLAAGGSGTTGEADGDGVRLALPRALGMGDGAFGVPTAARAEWDVAKDGATVEVRRLSARVGRLTLEGRGRWDDGAGGAGPTVDAEVDLRAELATAFRATGLALPASLSRVPDGRMGTATLHAVVRGPVEDAARLRIEPRLAFESAAEGVAALEFLRRPFRFMPGDDPRVPVDVLPGAPDFVALRDVPPLLLRALLVSEDAGFYGHPGVDVAEIPVAWAENAEREGPPRGASTITQQLAKNLFLSAERTYGRKLSEAALALVLDAAVPKERLLEIYVNVIEWGPGFRGLVPAARHYFGKSPAELTAKEIAFLVCLIPSPVRYHHAHTAGRLGPGMDQLVRNLLAKLRSVDAISEEEYLGSLEETLAFRPEDGPSPRSS
jgi:hypothetical protein